MTALQRRLVGLAKTVGFLVSLDAFFVAIKLLGAFKDVGSGYGETLMAGMAGRPLLGVLVGVLVTSIIQSSSTTTSLVVGLAAAGVFGPDPEIALATAVPIIMGANIGTTVTNTLVSFGHMGNRGEFRRAFAAATVHDMFNLLSLAVLLPFQILTNFLGRLSLWLATALADAGGLRLASPLRHLVDPQADLVERLFDAQGAVDFVIVFALAVAALAALGFLEGRRRANKRSNVHALLVAACAAGLVVALRGHGEHILSKPTAVFVTGLVVLLGALYAMVKIMRSVVLDRVAVLFNTVVFRTTARALLVGLVLTALVQSSSVTTSLVVPLAAAGLLSLRQIFPYTLGANLGTTVTALLAALALPETVGLAVALAHLGFNLLGTAIFLPLGRLPIALAQKLADGAVRSRAIPVAYVLGVYVLLPLVLIWLCGEVD